MKVFGKTPYGRDGWPVEFIRNRPIMNFLRLLIHTDWKRTRGNSC